LSQFLYITDFSAENDEPKWDFAILYALSSFGDSDFRNSSIAYHVFYNILIADILYQFSNHKSIYTIEYIYVYVGRA